MALEVYYENIGDDEPRARLIVKHNGKVILQQCDGGEPEDNYFFRDWSWVSDAIVKAYELGKQDAK